MDKRFWPVRPRAHWCALGETNSLLGQLEVVFISGVTLYTFLLILLKHCPMHGIRRCTMYPHCNDNPYEGILWHTLKLQTWSQFADELTDFKLEENRGQAVHCLNLLITNALHHVPDVLKYMSRIINQSVFNFCAIPQVNQSWAYVPGKTCAYYYCSNDCLMIHCRTWCCESIDCLAGPCSL